MTYTKLWDNINVIKNGNNALVTGDDLRKQLVEIAKLFINCKEGDVRHKAILECYNNRKPLPRGYKVKDTDAWCATSTSAWDIMLGIAEYTAIECSCLKQIEIAKKLKIWVESDSYVPKPGDRMMYDWEDNGKGDNKGNPNHTGLIEKVVNGVITVIEGNYKNGCNRRTIKVNGKNIRGYICPNFDNIAKEIRGRLIVADFVDVPRGVYFEKELEWAKENNVVCGIDDTHFGPALDTNRAQMITLLYRLFGKGENVDIDLPFTDVNNNAFYYNALKWCYKNGIVEGISASEFAPTVSCKRAEVVVMLHRINGRPEPNLCYSAFDDVPADAWYNDAVTWAWENEIIKGVSATMFAPNDDLLRRDTVCLLYRYRNRF